MFILGNFLTALAQVLEWLIQIIWWLIIIRALLSWVSPDPSNPIVQMIERTTEPFLLPFRRFFPAYKLGIDLSPLFALLCLYFLKIFLIRTLIGIAVRLQ